MKNLRYILTLLCAIITCMSMAQAVIEFDERRYDFGTIEEELGKVSCNFEFKNTGNEPLVIANVRTSCGCTAPEYTQEPILPGATGNIKITFNPQGRPGKFSKSIYVYANTDPDRTILRITGEVTRNDNESQATQYAYRIGDMALSALHLPLSKIPKGRTSQGSIEVVNVGNEPIAPQAINVPAHMQVDFTPDTLHRGTRGVMSVTYNPDVIDDWGYRRDEFNIVGTTTASTIKSEATYNTISVSGVLQEDSDSYTEAQREQAPILVVGKPQVDFKVVTGTQKVHRDIYVINAGYSPLKIHKIRCDNGIITARIKKDMLKPGQSTLLTIELDPMRARSNTIMNDIYIVSNDPTNASQPIRITAELR